MDWKLRIADWAADRNLVEGSTPEAQMKKLLEEVCELWIAVNQEDRDEICDAIGDIQVVLAVIGAQLNIDIDHCRELAWNEIKDRKGRMENGVFVKEDD